MRWPSSPIAQAGMILALAGLCALISNAMASPSRRLGWLDRPVAAAPAAPATTDRFGADPSQPIREISTDDAWRLFEAKALFLDARRGSEFVEGHIPGAWNVSVWEASVDARITEFEALAKPASTAPLVLYCSGGDCEDSHLLASKLTALGYRNLLIYRAGYPDWIKRGHPSRKGGQP